MFAVSDCDEIRAMVPGPVDHPDVREPEMPKRSLKRVCQASGTAGEEPFGR
ncbi:hypothetical protein GCM10009838_85580 [Catenulispora subtropica]|uniref:Uncharacterized protein n=1 Tax=Catenulispora subtropica TaxID=450798 RepID=A0ABN2TDS4_9ACTN